MRKFSDGMSPILPYQISSMSLSQFLTVYGQSSQAKDLSRDDQLAVMNRLRASKGLPPIKKGQKRVATEKEKQAAVDRLLGRDGKPPWKPPQRAKAK